MSRFILSVCCAALLVGYGVQKATGMGYYVPYRAVWLSDTATVIIRPPFVVPCTPVSPCDSLSPHDSEVLALLLQARREAEADEQKDTGLLLDALDDNMDNLVGLYAFGELLDHDRLPPPELEVWYGQLSGKLRRSDRGRELAKRLGERAAKFYDRPYSDVEAQDSTGRTVALSSLAGAGKWVLLDVWASWCGPCLRATPGLAAAYNEFHDRGFEIYALSLDASRERWLAAVAAHNVAGINVFDPKGWEGEAVAAYTVRSLPANFLIDPDGRIVARNLHGKALDNALQRHLCDKNDVQAE
ncbi:MAG: TlpA family protein disulfide reductase [Rikenellaceae bacterium]|jgi:thiol-disulfide isomerase/thioredoxin|nr:TlpA family protein disulfide reductase [Rikenellaceae bacterium]